MARFKKKRFLFVFILIFLLLLLITPLKINLLDLFRLPLTFSSLILKEIRNFCSYRAILNENFSLKKKFNNLQKDYFELKEEILKAQILKDLISFKEEKKFKTQISHVIGREPSNWYASILIDKGRSEGIKEGDCVINQKGLVGRISQVGKFTSKVILITDPQFSCAGLIQRTRSQGIVKGSLLNKLFMSYFEDNPDLKIDDLVITSSYSTFAPGGILIGRITRIFSGPEGIKSEISPEAELGKLEEVLVILSEGKD